MCNWKAFKDVMCCRLLDSDDTDRATYRPVAQKMEDSPIVQKPSQSRQQPQQYKQQPRAIPQSKKIIIKRRRYYEDSDDEDDSIVRPIVAGALIYSSIMTGNVIEGFAGGLLV